MPSHYSWSGWRSRAWREMAVQLAACWLLFFVVPSGWQQLGGCSLLVCWLSLSTLNYFPPPLTAEVNITLHCRNYRKRYYELTPSSATWAGCWGAFWVNPLAFSFSVLPQLFSFFFPLSSPDPSPLDWQDWEQQTASG